MNTSTSPLLARPPALRDDPAATPAELTAIVELARARRAEAITVGSGRTPNALAAAEAIAKAWQAAGGRVTGTLAWPESAASWLRRAVRPEALGLVGIHHLHGLSGATANGSTWTVTHNRLVIGLAAQAR